MSKVNKTWDDCDANPVEDMKRVREAVLNDTGVRTDGMTAEQIDAYVRKIYQEKKMR